MKTGESFQRSLSSGLFFQVKKKKDERALTLRSADLLCNFTLKVALSHSHGRYFKNQGEQPLEVFCNKSAGLILKLLARIIRN